MEKFEDFVYDELAETTLQAVQITVSDGWTLRQLQNVKANAAAIQEAADEKINEYIDQIHACLKDMDGSNAAAISLMTGVPIEDFDNYGGLPDEFGESYVEE